MSGEAVERAPARILCGDAEARALAVRLADAPAIALDTEGDGMFRYQARLCTVQLASERELAVVDTLSVDARLFAPLLGPLGPEKVVHDVAFDARVLAAHGIALERVFDTAVAARFLGFAATGLASLLAQLFDVQLPKHHQQADWGERPLDPDAIAYLENDVRYLLPLREVLRERLRAAGIEDELREECAHVLREAQKSVPAPSPFTRVKGAMMRRPKERARIYELALVRDAIARELDVPPTRLLPNEQVLRLAEREAPPLEELTRRLNAQVRPYAERVHAALVRGEARADAPADELVQPGEMPSMREIALRKRRRELLTGFRLREATARRVDPQAILPGHCVSELVKLPRLDPRLLAEIPGLGACRIERYAARWQSEFARSWGG